MKTIVYSDLMHIYASIAQRLEHWSCKPGVVSSILTGGLIFLHGKSHPRKYQDLIVTCGILVRALLSNQCSVLEFMDYSLGKHIFLLFYIK